MKLKRDAIKCIVLNPNGTNNLNDVFNNPDSFLHRIPNKNNINLFMEKKQLLKNLIQSKNQLKFMNCSNAACNKIFLINSKEVEHGNGIHLCPDCFSKPKTHHTIECASCLSIIDFLRIEDGEEVATYYSHKCTCCDGTIDDEVRLSKINSVETYIHC